MTAERRLPLVLASMVPAAQRLPQKEGIMPEDVPLELRKEHWDRVASHRWQWWILIGLGGLGLPFSWSILHNTLLVVLSSVVFVGGLVGGILGSLAHAKSRDLAFEINRRHQPRTEGPADPDARSVATGDTTEAPGSWFCQDCGRRNAPDVRYCGSCGRTHR